MVTVGVINLRVSILKFPPNTIIKRNSSATIPDNNKKQTNKNCNKISHSAKVLQYNTTNTTINNSVWNGCPIRQTYQQTGQKKILPTWFSTQLPESLLQCSLGSCIIKCPVSERCFDPVISKQPNKLDVDVCRATNIKNARVRKST